MKIFLVFSCPSPEDWRPVALRPPDPGIRYVVIDNDSSPELEDSIASVASALQSKVHRIIKTPKWKIISDILAGQGAAASSEPILIASAADPRLTQPIEIDGLLGPAGAVSEDFVFSSDPTELMQTILAKTKHWQNRDVFAPAVLVRSRFGIAPTQVRPLENLATLMGVSAEQVAQDAASSPPAPVHPMLVDFYRGHLGDEAAGFLIALQTASQYADDFVDGDVDPAWRSECMREMLEILLLRIPNDPFYLQHKAVLEEAVAQCISTWALSNELTVDTTPESRMWCYIQREAFQMVAWRVAVIVGGLDLGRTVLRSIQQILHGRSGGAKRYGTWLEETRARSGRG